MPLPKPRRGESEDAFMARCMANAAMRQEYPKEDQRAAVCHSQYRGGKMEKLLLECVIEKTKDGTYHFVGSDENIDRDGEIIKVSGWDLTEFKKNPVILWGHNHSVPAIGKAEKVYKRNKQLHFNVRFASEGIHELADTVRKLIDDGILKAVSVGYISKKREYNDLEESAETGHRITTLEAELYELSVVNVGANQNALLASKGYTEDEIAILTGEADIEVEDEVVMFKDEPSTKDIEVSDTTLRVLGELVQDEVKKMFSDKGIDYDAFNGELNSDKPIVQVDGKAIGDVLEKVEPGQSDINANALYSLYATMEKDEQAEFLQMLSVSILKEMTDEGKYSDALSVDKESGKADDGSVSKPLFKPESRLSDTFKRKE